MRRRFVVVFALGLQLAIGQAVLAQSSPSSGEPTEAERSSDVVVLDPGEMPRQTLRFAFTEGQTHEMVMSLDIASRATGQAFETEWIESPTATVTSTWTVASVNDDGSYDIEAEITDVAVSDEGADPALAQQLRLQFESLVGFVTSHRQDERGRLSESETTFAPGADPPFGAPQAEQIDALALLQVPLPEEPVGPGAVWESTSTTTEASGAVMDLEVTTVFDSIGADGTLELRSRTRGIAEPQAMTLPGVPETVEATLERLETESVSRTTMDLGGPPLAGDVVTSSTTAIVVTAGDETVANETDMKMLVRFHSSREEAPPRLTGAFAPAAHLSDARSWHTATLLPDGRVLVVGGDGEVWDVYAEAYTWDPASDGTLPGGALDVARQQHTATLLPDGRVLVVGGLDGAFELVATAELWDPSTRTFHAAGESLVARNGHTATLLPDGRVLIVGGTDAMSAPVATAEVWDPGTESFGRVDSLTDARHSHATSVLPDGRVLVVGGLGTDFDVLATAEVWDPGSGFFAPAGALAQPRFEPVIALRPDGRVVVEGGLDTDFAAVEAAEEWDPASNGFLPTDAVDAQPVVPDAQPFVDRGSHTTTTLPDGHALVVGGYGSEPVPHASAEAWDPATSTLHSAGQLAEGRRRHSATLLPDGRVVIIGGGPSGPIVSDSVEVWDPATESFRASGPLNDARADHTATLLHDGRILVAGGWDGPTVLASAEIWDPAMGSSSRVDHLTWKRLDHTATLLPDGRVLFVGGTAGDSVARAEVWDPISNVFRPAGVLAEAREDHTATLLHDGRVLIVGGWGSDNVVASAELWDPDTESFEPAGSMAVERALHTATLLPDGRVLVAGGRDDGVDTLAAAEVWDPVTASFSPFGELAEGRLRHTATPMSDGRILFVGGRGDFGFLGSTEIWEPRDE